MPTEDISQVIKEPSSITKTLMSATSQAQRKSSLKSGSIKIDSASRFKSSQRNDSEATAEVKEEDTTERFGVESTAIEKDILSPSQRHDSVRYCNIYNLLSSLLHNVIYYTKDIGLISGSVLVQTRSHHLLHAPTSCRYISKSRNV